MVEVDPGVAPEREQPRAERISADAAAESGWRAEPRGHHGDVRRVPAGRQPHVILWWIELELD
jgi:hypothetical protein